MSLNTYMMLQWIQKAIPPNIAPGTEIALSWMVIGQAIPPDPAPGTEIALSWMVKCLQYIVHGVIGSLHDLQCVIDLIFAEKFKKNSVKSSAL